MASSGLSKRVAVLENKDGGNFVPFVRIIQHEGQSEAEAVAVHEAAHGPLGNCNRILRVVIRSPKAQYDPA